MTDNEIIKALECCMDEMGCKKGCPFFDPKSKSSHCGAVGDNGLEKLALDLINRQKAEIEKWKKNCDELYDQLNERQKAEVKIARRIGKAEAIKEFGERLNKEVDRMLNENWLFEAQAISSLYSIKNFIEKSKKEMVGDV